jgi:hypothetical protein
MHYKTSDQERVALGFGGHECNNGVHFCGFYETAAERDEIIIGYLRQGLADGAKVLYTPTERTAGDFLTAFRERFPGDGALIEDNPDLTINTARDLYYQDGSFSPLRMNANLNAFFETSQKKGGRTSVRRRRWCGRWISGSTRLNSWPTSRD